MSDEKTPIDRAVELFVYAPVGLAMTARDMLPGFIERGRNQITSQLGMAKMVGQFAVQQGQSEAERALKRARQQAQSTLEQLGGVSSSNGDADARSTPSAAASPPPGGGGAKSASPEQEPPPITRSGPAAAALAIPDYDSLSASQVVPRLSSLGADELEAVRAYEAAHRGRKTILNKIAQLQQA